MGGEEPDVFSYSATIEGKERAKREAKLEPTVIALASTARWEKLKAKLEPDSEKRNGECDATDPIPTLKVRKVKMAPHVLSGKGSPRQASCENREAKLEPKQSLERAHSATKRKTTRARRGTQAVAAGLPRRANRAPVDVACEKQEAKLEPNVGRVELCGQPLASSGG